MYYNDYSPAHFHAKYGSEEVLIDIKSLSPMEGKFSRRAINLVLDWAELHQQELEENWESCRNKEAPKKIAPLK